MLIEIFINIANQLKIRSLILKPLSIYISSNILLTDRNFT